MVKNQEAELPERKEGERSRQLRKEAAKKSTVVGGVGDPVGRDGNAGWYFGNWENARRMTGAVSLLSGCGVAVNNLLKRSPAQIIGVAGCDVHLESFLQEPGEDEAEAQFGAGGAGAAIEITLMVSPTTIRVACAIPILAFD